MSKLRLSDCRICRGLSKTKCMFCGEKLPRKMDMTDMEKIKLDGILDALAWLRKTQAQLRNMNMASTGSYETDEQIRKEVGDWGELSRGVVEAVNDKTYTVRIESGNSYEITANHRDYDVGQKVTVRFFGSTPKL